MSGDFSMALHALVFLYHNEQSMTSARIADNVCTNPARVRKVMTVLKKAGLVTSQEGAARGGYTLARRTITLRDIAAAIGEQMVCQTWRSGDQDRDCMVASGMAAVTDELCSELNVLCEQRLQEITLEDIHRRIVERKRAE